MSLQGLPAVALVAAAIVSAALVVLMYTIRWRLPRRLVASTAMWLAAAGRRRGGGRLGAFEHVLSLVLQLVLLALLVTALGQPRFGCQSPTGQRVVLVLDRSSSMAAIERVDRRLDIARRRATDRLARSAAGDSLGLVLAGGEPEIAAPLDRDPTAIRRAIERAEITAGPGHLDRAVALACHLVDGEDGAVVVITDATEPFSPCAHARLERISVGTPRPNAGVTAFQTAIAPRDPLHATGYVEVMNAWREKATVELRVDLDGDLVQVVPLELGPGERVHRVIEGIPLTGTRLVAHLSKIAFADGARDALVDDDTAYALGQRRARIPVDLVGKSTPLELVLAANPRYVVTPRKEPSPTGSAITVVVGPLARPLGPGRYLLVHPSGQGSPVELGPTVPNPQLTYWHDEHPILRRVVLSDVLFGEATQALLPPSASALAGSRETPILFTLAEGGRRVVGLTADLDASNLPLRVGFPVLVYNAIDWLLDARIDEAASGGDVRSGEPLLVTAPGGKPERIEPIAGLVHVRPGAPGFYPLTTVEGRPFTTLAMSVGDAGETALVPVEDKLPAPSVGPGGRLRDRDFAGWLYLLALGGILVEWYTYHRRKTV